MLLRTCKLSRGRLAKLLRQSQLASQMHTLQLLHLGSLTSKTKISVPSFNVEPSPESAVQNMSYQRTKDSCQPQGLCWFILFPPPGDSLPGPNLLPLSTILKDSKLLSHYSSTNDARTPESGLELQKVP